MAIRGQLSGCYLLSEAEYRTLREDQAAAAHWRAEHDRVCQELDAANVRADGANVCAEEAEAEGRICQFDRGDGWGRYHDAQTDIEQLRMVNRGLVDGQRSLMQERDEARRELVEYRAIFDGLVRGALERLHEPPPPPGVSPPPRRVPLHAVRPDERRE